MPESMPKIGDTVYFVFEYRPRIGIVVVHGARASAAGNMPDGDPAGFVQISTADTDANATELPTWNVPMSSLGREAPNLADLFDRHGAHRVAEAEGESTGYHKLMATAARQELVRRYALAKNDHPIMWDEHLNGTHRSARRQRELTHQARKIAEHQRKAGK